MRLRFWVRVALRRSPLTSAVVVAAWHAHQGAGLDNPQLGRQRVYGLKGYGSAFSVVGVLAPSSAATFFWRSMISSAWVRRVWRRAFSARSWASSS